MPLTAYLGERELQAPFVDPDEWAALKGKTPRPLLSCGAEAVVKNSALGTPFFAHHRRADGDEHKGESPEHLLVKTAIMLAARSLGWDARAEVAAPDRRWIADVMATSGDRRIAFEVQLAGQTGEDYDYRQRRYDDDGIEVLWLVRRYDSRRMQHVPALQLDLSSDSMQVRAAHGLLECAGLYEVVEAALRRTLRWVPHPSGHAEASVRWGAHQCYRCKTLSVVYRKGDELRSTCDSCAVDEYGGQFTRTSVAPLRAMRERGVKLDVAAWENRPTIGSPKGELGFSCPKCQSPFYESHLHWLDDLGAVITTAALEPTKMRGHWCVSGQALHSGRSVISYILGSEASPATEPDGRTADELCAEARDREERRKRNRQQERDRGVSRSSPQTVPPPPSRSQISTGVRQSASDIRERRQQDWEPTTPPPPWHGEQPTNPHERTTALDVYTKSNLRYVDELLEQFPAMTGECVCRECRAVHQSFPKNQRKRLWPGRERGRVDWATGGPPSAPQAEVEIRVEGDA